MHHCVKGEVVLPVVYVINWFYEFMEERFGRSMTYHLENLCVLSGIKLGKFDDQVAFLVKFSGEELALFHRDRVAYRARCLLDSQIRNELDKPEDDYGQDENTMRLSQEIYSGKTLFHGPKFQVINKLLTCSVLSASAELKANYWSSDEFVDRPMLDGGLQLACVWVRSKLNKASLPMRMSNVRIYAKANGANVICYLTGKIKDNTRCQVDLQFCENGRLLAEMSGIDMLTYQE